MAGELQAFIGGAVDLAVRKKHRTAVLCLLASVGLSITLVLGQILGYPSGLRDLVTGRFDPAVQLVYPSVYALFAPFFQAADHVSILGVRQHAALWAAAAAGWIAFRVLVVLGTPWRLRVLLRESGLFLAACGVLALFLAVTILVPRPMARLRARDPDVIVVNFHSHTSASWDGRKSYGIRENLDWHVRAGFQANFITDHNLAEAALEARSLAGGGRAGELIPMAGEEVSLHRSHWVVLGIRELIPNGPYDRGPEGVREFLQAMSRRSDLLVIASLPEYWLHDWGGPLQDVIRWGVDGIEIANSAPKALDFPPEMRREVVRLCRENRLFMTGITDSHGWGSACYAWNLVSLPGWRALPRERVEPALIGVLKKKRHRAVRVMSRVRAEPRPGWRGTVSDPFLQAWEACRSMPLTHAASCLAWLWAPWIWIRPFRGVRPMGVSNAG